MFGAEVQGREGVKLGDLYFFLKDKVLYTGEASGGN
jgi:hypothetical protein